MARKNDTSLDGVYKFGQCNEHGACLEYKDGKNSTKRRCGEPCGKEAMCNKFNTTHVRCTCRNNVNPTFNLTCPNEIDMNSKYHPPSRPLPQFMGKMINATSNRGVPSNAVAADPVLSVETIAAVGASVMIASVLLIVLALYLCKTKKKHSNAPLSLDKNVLVSARYAANPQYSSSLPMQEVPCVPQGVRVLERAKLQLAKELGEGCFGKVFEGELNEDDATSRVAIKMLKSSASQEAEEDFMREVEVMSSFHNEHILTLIGIVLRDSIGEPWMVFEFMTHGDLAEVLRANSMSFGRRPTPGLPPLGPSSLHSISLQVASGMAYLAEQHFVHRDLACRNCLVGEGLVVKIADFGMSRDVYTCDYYKVGGARLLPIRWMSPESILYGRYTLESDVWSFGVLLWEIYSLGRQPYYGYTNEEVVKLILQGSLLTAPAMCPPLISDIMLRCWRREPKDRVKFPEIKLLLQESAPQYHWSQEMDLPLPPAHLEQVELLDQDQYLLPIPQSPPEYLETLP
ncbi:Hypothetical predicted protein [Cloeon dipterum]|uniref:Protein kinase domain-containing protein n=1 Tax=Cloeon dipterum TaxID=197152 RepID=A0A8S1D8S0_9INSE|nr:Hypothetical predicted protein [Cloeon dipterum]